MRTALILGRKHNQKKFSVIGTPDVPLAELQERMKDLRRATAHDELAEVEFWTSDAGRISTHRLHDPKNPPKAPPVIDHAKARAEAKAKADKEAADKAQKTREAEVKANNDRTARILERMGLKKPVPAKKPAPAKEPAAA